MQSIGTCRFLVFTSRQWREVPIYWPWNYDWWKPTPDNRIRELEKGIAQGMAEIDRLERKEEQKMTQDHFGSTKLIKNQS